MKIEERERKEPTRLLHPLKSDFEQSRRKHLVSFSKSLYMFFVLLLEELYHH